MCIFNLFKFFDDVCVFFSFMDIIFKYFKISLVRLFSEEKIFKKKIVLMNCGFYIVLVNYYYLGNM